MPGIDTKLRQYLAAYAVLLAAVAAVGVMVVLLVLADARMTASEQARPCTGAPQQQHDCLVAEHVMVMRKWSSSDPEDYNLVTAAGSVTVDEDFYTVVRVGDEVDFVSYDGRVIRVSQGGRGSGTGAYTRDVDGCLIFLGMTVTMMTVAVVLTVTVHRSGDYEGMVLFWSVALAPLSTMLCGLLTQPHLRAAVACSAPPQSTARCSPPSRPRSSCMRSTRSNRQRSAAGRASTDGGTDGAHRCMTSAARAICMRRRSP